MRTYELASLPLKLYRRLIDVGKNGFPLFFASDEFEFIRIGEKKLLPLECQRSEEGNTGPG